MKKLALVLTALALTTVTATVPSTSAEALASQWERTVIYYTDDTYTEEAGQFVYFCDGTFARWGQITLYHQETFFSCP